jgi:hypothetical protein
MMGLFFANVAVMGGWLIYVLLFLWRMEWLAIPLTFGFPLIGPFLVVGLYEVSRRLEAGQTEWKRNDIFGVIWRQRARQLPLMSWVIIVYYLFWSFFAHMLFALFLGPSVLTNVTSSYAYLLEPEGLRMLLVGSAFGAVFAFVLFMITAVSLPLLLDKELDFVTAMLTSIAVVRKNPGVMVTWAAVIAADDLPRDVAVSLRAVPRAAGAGACDLAHLPPGFDLRRLGRAPGLGIRTQLSAAPIPVRIAVIQASPAKARVMAAAWPALSENAPKLAVPPAPA